MAYFDHDLTGRLRPVQTLFRRLLDTPFDARVRERAARVAELRAMSDEDLAAIGLSRDRILQHVFRTRHRAR